jgi:hypothetical protein
VKILSIDLRMEKLQKNLKVFAVFSAETPDTSGEVLNIRNADISSLQSGSAPINTEHKNPEDLEKTKDDEKSDSHKGFNTIIGRVVSAKKIFSAEDCENDHELAAWNDLKVPLITGVAEFFDDPKHPNAQAATALIRQAAQGGFDHMIGFSVEGNVLKRTGPQLDETVIRRLAATGKPCNKAAQIKAIIQDSPSEASKPDVMTKASQDGSQFLSSFNNQRHFHVLPEDYGLKAALTKLKKAMSAGGANAAPSTLTGGSALQTSSHLAKLEKLFRKKRISSEAVKKAIPKLSKAEADQVATVLQARRLKKNTQEFEEIYDKLFKA